MAGIGFEELIVICFIGVFVFLLIVLPYWKIFGKAGYHPGLSILMVIPIVNVAMLFFLAFSKWPSLKQQKQEDPNPTSIG